MEKNGSAPPLKANLAEYRIAEQDCTCACMMARPDQWIVSAKLRDGSMVKQRHSTIEDARAAFAALAATTQSCALMHADTLFPFRDTACAGTIAAGQTYEIHWPATSIGS